MGRPSIRSRRLRGPAAFLVYLTTCGLGTAAILVHGTGCSTESDANIPAATNDVLDETDANAAAADGLQYDPRQSLAPLVDAVSPAVVSIHAKGRRVSAKLSIFGSRATEGSGSGFVLDGDGIVVTNHHVVDGARAVEVRLLDGRSFDAQILGSDAATDLAVLRLDGAKDLPTVVLGDSKDLRVGDWLVAMGSPMGLEHSATVGILSGRSRGHLGLYPDSYLDFLQTDAAIAKGSSGGPLFDLSGRVVGITTAVGAAGPGFAIPIDQAKSIIPQLRTDGKVVRGWLGAASVEGDRSRGGARIGQVFAGTPAARAGLRAGDLVTELDGVNIDSFDELRMTIAERRPGHAARLTVQRLDSVLDVTAVLAERPQTDQLRDLREATHHEFREPGDFGDRLGVRARNGDGKLEILEVEPRSLAAELDLRPGDVLRRINGIEIRSPSDVSHALRTRSDVIEIEILRQGIPHRITSTHS